jgi:divalent metal cation (Fe/Co/Zn/Cd) transporter
LERRARQLAWGGIAWHFVEFAIAIAAGLIAGSIALIGFGADSLIEALAGFVVVWLFTGTRRGSQRAERQAQQLIAISFYVLAAYVAVEATRTLVAGSHPEKSWVGIGLAAFTAATMPLLASAKRRVGARLHSSAAVKEASQTQLCAYLSIALLIGLGANAVLGWWWADPVAALFIAGVAAYEGRSSWRGEGCCDAC